MPEKPEDTSRIELSRRRFLGSLAGAAMTLAAPRVIASAATATVPLRDRELSLYNIHTGEKLSAAFWSGGNYLDDGIREISWLLRDYRSNAAHPIDPKLLDLLYQLQAKVEHQGAFHVISGYRSPATNAMLHKNSSGVARHSYHMLGKAIDVRMPDFNTRHLRNAAIALKEGGVGYYASSDFVHVDVGRVRYW